MLTRTILLLCVLVYGFTVQAQTITMAGGQTIKANVTEHDAYRAEVNFPWKSQLWSNDRWALSLKHALSIMSFRDKNTVNAISWAPNLILTGSKKSGIYPYAQFGIGVAYLSDDKFESNVSPRYRYNGDLIRDDGTSDMGSHGQFENSFALGLIKGRFGIRAKVYHYSNANLTSSNGGMDVAELGISYEL